LKSEVQVLVDKIWLKACAVVLDHQSHFVAFSVETDPDILSHRVLNSIAESLSHNVVRKQLDNWRSPDRIDLCMESRRPLRRESADEQLQRGGKSVRTKWRRP
jgi:hypothetical protein